METNTPHDLDIIEATLSARLEKDAKVLRCYQCGRVLPNGYDDVNAHSPRCPRLITMKGA